MSLLLAQGRTLESKKLPTLSTVLVRVPQRTRAILSNTDERDGFIVRNWLTQLEAEKSSDLQLARWRLRRTHGTAPPKACRLEAREKPVSAQVQNQGKTEVPAQAARQSCPVLAGSSAFSFYSDLRLIR